MSKKEIAINTLLNSANKTKKIYPEILSLNNGTVHADTACLGNNPQFESNEDEQPHIN